MRFKRELAEGTEDLGGWEQRMQGQMAGNEHWADTQSPVRRKWGKHNALLQKLGNTPGEIARKWSHCSKCLLVFYSKWGPPSRAGRVKTCSLVKSEKRKLVRENFRNKQKKRKKKRKKKKIHYLQTLWLACSLNFFFSKSPLYSVPPFLLQILKKETQSSIFSSWLGSNSSKYKQGKEKTIQPRVWGPLCHSRETQLQAPGFPLSLQSQMSKKKNVTSLAAFFFFKADFSTTDGALWT